MDTDQTVLRTEDDIFETDLTAWKKKMRTQFD